MTGPHPPAFDFTSLLERTTDAFAGAVRTADLDAPVAACPGWQVRDLVGHVGAIHGWAAAIVESGTKQPYEEGPVDGTGAAAAEWYADRAGRLLEAVRDIDLEDPCWNFSGVHQTRGFWPRRQVHETRVHLFDLDSAAVGGGERIFDPALSADGVTEVFQVFYPRMAQRGRPVVLDGPLRILATDLGMSWLLMPDADQGAKLTWRGGDAPVAEVEGSASDLLRMLWKRPLSGDLATEGDSVLIDHYLESAHTP